MFCGGPLCGMGSGASVSQADDGAPRENDSTPEV